MGRFGSASDSTQPQMYQWIHSCRWQSHHEETRCDFVQEFNFGFNFHPFSSNCHFSHLLSCTLENFRWCSMIFFFSINEQQINKNSWNRSGKLPTSIFTSFSKVEWRRVTFFPIAYYFLKCCRHKYTWLNFIKNALIVVGVTWFLNFITSLDLF